MNLTLNVCVYGKEEERNRCGGLDDRIERRWSGWIGTMSNETNEKKTNFERM